MPITNYGLAIAYTLGIFERALQPFPAALEARARGAGAAGRARTGGAGDRGLPDGAAVDDLC